MRIRRWEQEEEFDRYMRDRTGEGCLATRPPRLRKVAVLLNMGARGAWVQAITCAALGLAVLRDVVCR